ncbi:hypothetical protein [Cyanobium gracile]|uniref:hypothetical protein n=1 Tax=Cyanobium gracile TaxID=59930 RepID=UPI0002E14411|nr:hypothetical protein [Cyanobium gracile]
MAFQARPSETTSAINDTVLLRKVLQRAGEELGLAAQEMAQAIGRSRTFLMRHWLESANRHTGWNPCSNCNIRSSWGTGGVSRCDARAAVSPAPQVDLTAITRLDGVVMRLVEQQGAQTTGQRMREAGIEAFDDHSARSDDAVMLFGAISCCVFPSTPLDQVDV